MPSTDSSLDQLLLQSANAQRSGLMDESERLAKRALEMDGTCIAAKFMLGVLYARKGDVAAASKYLGFVLDADPNAYEALVSLSTLYRENGRTDEAVTMARRAVTLRPNDAQAHNNLGRALLAGRKLPEAAEAFVKATTLQPGYSAAFYNLGRARQLEGRDRDAADAFAEALRLAPTLKNHLAFGQILIILCDFEGALECGNRCVSLFPDSAAAHLLLCGALLELSRFDEAQVYLESAIELDVSGQESLEIAIRQRALGHVHEANENYRKAIAANPRMVWAYDGLIQNHRVTEADRPLVERLAALLEEGNLAETELVPVHYGLGKAYEDLGEYGPSMLHYDEANRITRKLKMGDAVFSESDYREHVDEVYGAYAEGRNSSSREGSELPVLVVGMMRSGTTLAEQILSSHPGVCPAGEQLFWSQNWRRAVGAGSEEFEALGREYLEVLLGFGSDARRVTDKMPGNYLFSGIIHLALPNARLIHMRRCPADNCLSIWATPNSMPHEGGHNKANIVFVYRQYLRLMELWRANLPDDRFLEVDYEELVSNYEPTARRMIEFCGLDWDDACLSPERNKRTVLTPSAWQVRQPVYKTSVERWRKFEGHLGEFEELIEVRHPTPA